MENLDYPIIVIGIIVVYIISLLIWSSIKLSQAKNYIELADGQLDTVYKQRFDLIPNLIDTARHYAEFERETLERLVQLRNNLPVKGLAQSDDALELDSQLRNLRVQMEAYPDLKSNANFLHLQQQLSLCELDLAAARRQVNGNIVELNNLLTLPWFAIIAPAMGITHRPMLTINDEERAPINAADLLNR